MTQKRMQTLQATHEKAGKFCIEILVINYNYYHY